MRRIDHAGFEIMLSDDPTYTPGSADNLRRYAQEIPLCDERAYLAARLGIAVTDATGEVHSAVLLGCGGATAPHENSAVTHADTLYVACGRTICALRLPALTPLWMCEVDFATCFGVYLLPLGAGLLSHGELTIARLSLGGKILWTAGGRDIFTGDFAVLDDRVRAVDWNRDVYTFALADGRSLEDDA